jgi:predicted ATPase
MSRLPNNWYVLTGAPCSGKTTTILELANKGYQVVPEIARLYVDAELAKGRTLPDIAINTRQFEEIVTHLKVENEQQLDPKATVFLDRGMHDTLAYYKLYGWPVSDVIQSSCHAARYAKIFLLEMLPYQMDYARTESETDARKLQELFRLVYREAGYDVISVPVASVDERVAFILDHLNRPDDVHARNEE